MESEIEVMNDSLIRQSIFSSIFGENLDIHSGGDDLRFPHHENEMAQSEACFCTNQWTNYWVHTGRCRRVSVPTTGCIQVGVGVFLYQPVDQLLGAHR